VRDRVQKTQMKMTVALSTVRDKSTCTTYCFVRFYVLANRLMWLQCIAADHKVTLKEKKKKKREYI
jgi:hypothetical protein